MAMELYAAGFNAWNQLRFRDGGSLPADDDEEPDDLHEFTCVSRDDCIGHVTSALSYTLVTTRSGDRTAGVVPEEDATLRKCHGSYVQAANGSVAVTLDSRTICQYGSILEALAGGGPRKTHRFPNDVVQLVAYDVGFAALSSAGEVWTWGDDRYPACLARDVPGSRSAMDFGLVVDLEELPTGKITKIAAGGYILAALTSGGDLYCWGGHPGRKPIIDDDILGGPVPIVVEEESDVVDVAVGDSHLIVLTGRGGVFVVGENSNGQLGLGRDSAASISSWTNVDFPPSSMEIVGVAAGPRCSFIKVKHEADEAWWRPGGGGRMEGEGGKQKR